MSKDIRSYFSSVGGKKPNSSETTTKSPTSKRKALPLSSDEDEPKHKTTPKDKNHQNKKNVKNSSKKRRIIDSDEEIEATPPPPPSSKLNKKPTLSKLKVIPDEKSKIKDVEKFFDDIPKRVERKKPIKLNCTTVTSETNLLEGDDDFEKSVCGIDEKELLEENEKKVPDIKTNGNSESEHKTTPKKSKEKETKPQKYDEKKNTDSSSKVKKEIFKTPEKPKIEKNIKSPSTSKHESSLKTKSSLSESSPKKESPINKKSRIEKTPKQEERTYYNKSDHESSGMSDEDRHEKKRLAAILYQQFKNRKSVINPGCKEVPKGKPNCLAGLSFLITGILESLQRDEAANLVKKLGGKISTTVGKRLNYMVVGEEAGPKKLATAEELGITILSEDGLLDLIREKSGEKTHNNTSNTSATSSKKSPSSDKKERKSSPEKRKIEKSENGVPEKKIKKESPKKVINDEVKPEIVEPSVISNEKPPKNLENLAWVEKYKPTNLKQIIGQQGAASNVVKLKNWLSNWYSNHDGKKKLQKPNPWAKNDDGSFYKAALLSGPPGVGKTTTVTLVCKEFGFDTVEFNASDTRNKKLLKEEVSELLSNKSLFGYFHGNCETVSKKHVLVMDEVDGMAGNEDRGGVQELISLIKETSIPIICMCNDRNHPKMRSIVNYCYDLRFNRPRLEQIKGPMMSICYRENIKLPPQKIDEIISATNHDIRQTINYLTMIAAGKELNLDNDKNETAKKYLKLGPWDVVRKVFSAEEHKHMTINDKSDLFFMDYSLGPLFVQQNYLQVKPKCSKEQIPQQVAKTADSLSLGDLVEKRIRNNSAWSLLPTQAMFSSVLPGEYMAGHFTGQINFPAWLGKYSKTTKRSRLAQEIHSHTRTKTSGSRLSIRLEYAPFLLDAIVRPLKRNGLDGVEQALDVIKEYRLLKEDIESLIELTTWPGRKNPMESIDGKVKAALTRAYNKEVLAYSYSAIAGVKRKRGETADADMEYLEDEGIEGTSQSVEEENEDDDLEHDALIKAKKKPSKATSEPSTSKKGDSKKSKTDSKKTASTSKGKGKK